VGACRAIGARVRWLYRLGAVSTTRPARSGAEPKAAALVTLVAAEPQHQSRVPGGSAPALAAPVEVAGTSAAMVAGEGEAFAPLAAISRTVVDVVVAWHWDARVDAAKNKAAK